MTKAGGIGYNFGINKGRKGLLKKTKNMLKKLTFFKDVYGELLKVTWPSRQMVIRYTLLVIVFSLVVAIILGAADLGLLALAEKFFVNK